MPNSQSSPLQRQDDGSILGELALALLRRDRLHLLDLSYFLRPEPREAFDQLRGDGLGERESDRALSDLIRYKIVL